MTSCLDQKQKKNSDCTTDRKDNNVQSSEPLLWENLNCCEAAFLGIYNADVIIQSEAISESIVSTTYYAFVVKPEEFCRTEECLIQLN